MELTEACWSGSSSTELFPPLSTSSFLVFFLPFFLSLQSRKLSFSSFFFFFVSVFLRNQKPAEKCPSQFLSSIKYHLSSNDIVPRGSARPRSSEIPRPKRVWNRPHTPPFLPLPFTCAELRFCLFCNVVLHCFVPPLSCLVISLEQQQQLGSKLKLNAGLILLLVCVRVCE